MLGVRGSIVRERRLLCCIIDRQNNIPAFSNDKFLSCFCYIGIKSWVTCHKLPQVGYFSLIAVWASRLYVLIACLPREVDLGGEEDSWHNIWTLEPGNERQLLDLILNIALDQIRLDPACPATAKSLVGVERQEVEDTARELF